MKYVWLAIALVVFLMLIAVDILDHKGWLIGPKPDQAVISSDFLFVRAKDMEVGESGWVSRGSLAVDENHKMWLYYNALCFQKKKDVALPVWVGREENGFIAAVSERDYDKHPAAYRWLADDIINYQYYPVIRFSVEGDN